MVSLRGRCISAFLANMAEDHFVAFLIYPLWLFCSRPRKFCILLSFCNKVWGRIRFGRYATPTFVSLRSGHVPDCAVLIAFWRSIVVFCHVNDDATFVTAFSPLPFSFSSFYPRAESIMYFRQHDTETFSRIG